MSISKQTTMNGHGTVLQDSTGNYASNSLDRTTSDKVDMLVNVGEGTLGRLLRGPSPGKFFSFFLLVPALIAFGISCYLAYAAVTASDVAGCTGGQLFDCNHVLHSKYAKWMGIPVSILAAGNYLFMVVALATICFSASTTLMTRISWAVVTFAGIAAGMAAVWFVGLQVFAIGKLCPWCLGAHSCGAVIALSLLVKRPVGGKLMAGGSGLAAMGIAALIIGQVMAEEPVKYKIIEHDVSPGIRTNSPGIFSAPGDGELFSPPKEEDGNVFEAPMDASSKPKASSGSSKSGSFSASLIGLIAPTAMVSYSGTLQEDATKQEEDEKQEEGTGAKAEPKKKQRRTVSIQGNLELDPKQWPLLGSPDAKHIFVEMFDYACPHCRATHSAIKGACENMGEDVAVIVLPVPLNSACNSAVTVTGANFGESCEMAKLAVACWRLDAAKFQEFHHWMFEGASVPTYAAAKAKADEMMGREALDAELRKEAPGKYITKHVQLYQHAGKGVVPKLMFPTTTVEGEFTSTMSLVNLIRERAK